MMKKLIVPICILLLSTAALSQTRSRTTKRGTQAAKPAMSLMYTSAKQDKQTPVTYRLGAGGEGGGAAKDKYPPRSWST